MKTRITELFGIQYPIIQAGMIWVSGYKLAAAAANAGILGLIGAGSMKPELLREHIHKARAITSQPFGVNVPLLRKDASEIIQVCLDEGVTIVFTSAGHPGKFIDQLKSSGCIVAHVVSSVKQAEKVEAIGCDAVVVEGFEAGGHNGSEETTTFCLIPTVSDSVSIPVIAAGGIADGRGMLAAMALGAEGVQIGTRFAASVESSAHDVFKTKILEAREGDTILTFKKIAPVRLIKTPFALRAVEAEQLGATKEEQLELMATKREKIGMFEGNVEEGQFEAGQCASLVKDVFPVQEIVDDIIKGFEETLQRLFRDST